MSATDYSSPMMLPNDLNYELPKSLPSSKNTLVVCQPVNGSSFNAAGQVIQIDIPCQRNSYMLNPHFRYKSTYVVGGGTTASTDVFYKLGTSYSPFNQQNILANNANSIERIQEIGQLANFIFRSTLTDAELKGMSGFISASHDSTQAQSYSASSNVGHLINNAAATADLLTFDSGSPVIGVLNSDKMFPLGKLSSLRFELTLDDVANYTQGATAQAVTSGITSVTISDFEFCFNSIQISDEAQMMIDQAIGSEKLLLRTRSWKHSAGTPLSAQAGAGTYQVQCGIRASSLCGIVAMCHTPNMVDKKFGSISANYTAGTCFLINGNQMPQRGLDPSNKPSQISSQLQTFWGGLNSTSHSGSYGKLATYRSSTNSGLLVAYDTTIANGDTSPNQSYFAVDTEVISKKSDVLLAGISVDSPMFFNAVIGSQLANQVHYLNFHGLCDVILEFDLMTKSCVAKY